MVSSYLASAFILLVLLSMALGQGGGGVITDEGTMEGAEHCMIAKKIGKRRNIIVLAYSVCSWQFHSSVGSKQGKKWSKSTQKQ